MLAKILTFKVNKGGIGKTFLTVQTGSGLATAGKKTLIITSDSQNNVLNYTFSFEEKPIFKKGLKHFVKTGDGDLIRLRENLYYIPLEDNKFSSSFIKELPEFIKKISNDYDFILIDSIPTMKLDSIFVKCSDKVIIPYFCDPVTLEGVLNVIDEVGANKIHAIVPNLYRNTETQKKFYNNLKTILKDTRILFPEPIKESSAVESLLAKGKTIWESEQKDIRDVQDIFINIIGTI